MSEPLSSNARSLLDAAKADGPSAAARAKMWRGISAAAGGAGAASAGPRAADPGLGSAAGVKVLAAGTLFGSAITVGLALVLLRVAPAPAPPPEWRPAAAGPRAVTAGEERAASDPASSPAVAVSAVAPPGALVRAGPPVPHVGDGGAAARPLAPLTAGPLDSRSRAGPTVTAPPPSAARRQELPVRDGSDREDPMLREASLVAEARSALRRGDPEAALAALRAARSVTPRTLEPEELALEAQALRAIGKGGDAKRTEGDLRARYPDHALAR